jgi:hypothetical protein
VVTLFRGPSWKIAVYARDHGIPHFHIEGPDFRCVSIASGEVIIGSAPRQVLAAARAWARDNRAALMRSWRALNR